MNNRFASWMPAILVGAVCGGIAGLILSYGSIKPGDILKERSAKTEQAAVSRAAPVSKELFYEHGTDKDMVRDVQKTLDSFNQILSADMNVALTRRIKVYICPTQENYTRVLERELNYSTSAAKRTAGVTGGISGDKANTVALNGSAGIMNNSYGRTYSTAHEVFHQVQFQLANGRSEKVPYWLKEGSAELIGARVSEKMGHQSVERWQQSSLKILRKADAYASPSDIMYISYDKWTTLMERDLHPYRVAGLMVYYLVVHVRDGNYGDIAKYYTLIGDSVDEKRAFEQAFGLTQDRFLAHYQAWFAKVK